MVKTSSQTDNSNPGEKVYRNAEEVLNRIFFALGLENRIARGEQVNFYLTKRNDGVVELSTVEKRGEVRVIYEETATYRSQ